MTELEKLQQRFGVRGLARIEAGVGGLPRISITHPLADGTIYLHGAHVTGYKPAGQSNVLFMSAKSQFAPGKAIRGGVPICFPWFGARQGHPDAPLHGFARLMDWELESINSVPDGVAVVLKLSAGGATRTWWDADFELRYTVVIGRSLRLSLQVINKGQAPLVYEQALHSYFQVTDVRQVALEGLAEATYMDKTQGMIVKVQDARQLRLTAETDRIYLNTQSTCTVRDTLARRHILIAKEHSNNTVVWNPWVAKAATLPDFGDDEWPEMLCVETANVGDYAIDLLPGQAHAMSVVVHAVSED